ncbi:unnamed protein product, partial [Mesorhabditis spiculigera]
MDRLSEALLDELWRICQTMPDAVLREQLQAVHDFLGERRGELLVILAGPPNLNATVDVVERLFHYDAEDGGQMDHVADVDDPEDFNNNA